MPDVGGFAWSCFSNLSEDLGVRRISAKFILFHLTVVFKESSVKIRTDPEQQTEADKNFMKWINTSD